MQHRDGMRHFDFNARFNGDDEPLEVDWAILFDRHDRSPGRLEVRVFPFETTATVGAQNVVSGKILDFPLEDFDLFASGSPSSN